MHGALPFTHKHRAGLGAPTVGQRDHGPALPGHAVQRLQSRPIEPTECVLLQPVGQSAVQERLGQSVGSRSPERAPPALTQAGEIERGQPLQAREQRWIRPGRRRDLGLPPEKWSSLRYGSWPCGGLFDVEEAAQA